MSKGPKKLNQISGEYYSKLSTPSVMVIPANEKVKFDITEWQPDTTPKEKQNKRKWQWLDKEKNIIQQFPSAPNTQFSISLPKKLCGSYLYYAQVSIEDIQKSSIAKIGFRGYCPPKITKAEWRKLPNGQNIANGTPIKYGDTIYLYLETEGLNGDKLTVEVYNQDTLLKDKAIRTIVDVEVNDGKVCLKIPNTTLWMGAVFNIQETEEFYVKVKNLKGQYIVNSQEEQNHAEYLKIKKEVVSINIEKPTNTTALKIGKPTINTKDYSNPHSFNITFEVDKSEKTLVPLGILDFNNNYENPYFSFKYKLTRGDLDSLNFEILDENRKVIYQMNYLAPIVVKAPKKPMMLLEVKNSTPKFDPSKPIKAFDIASILKEYAESYENYTKVGEYIIHWDGFDTNEIFDSTIFDNKKLTARITASKGIERKRIEVAFETTRKEVDWVDVKINKKTKRIDVTLRVDLKDGGANGLDCKQVLKGMRDNTHWVTECPWDAIPTTAIQPNKPIIKTRTRSFADLEKLALDGLNYHWGRNKNHTVAKDVKISGVSYEVYVNSKNTTEKTMDDVDLIYNTNNNWLRSNNPGKVTGVKSFFANVAQYIPYVPLSESIYYNVGYLNNVYTFESDVLQKEDWTYVNDKLLYKNGKSKLDLDYSYTSAHEIGHTILRAYAEGSGSSADYSYEHKGSSGYSDTKPVSEGGFAYPVTGEIDLMKYYNNNVTINNKSSYIYFLDYDFERITAEEKDVLGLLWLTKIKIE
ncbi:zinc metalloprotease [Flavobacterium oreochromis]